MRQLEWSGDQVCVLGVGRARPDRRFCLAYDQGKLLDENDPWQRHGWCHGRQLRINMDGGKSLSDSLRNRIEVALGDGWA